jgi:septal ring factor EnvC (AmiA/AmiB activator)
MIAPNVYAASFVIELIQAWGTPALVAGLLGTGGLGALVPAIIAWRKAPVERKDADIAAADAAQGMSLKLAQELRTEIDRLRSEMGELRIELRAESAQRRDLGDKVREQEGTIFKLRVYVSRVTDWWEHHVVADWERVRTKPEPPVFPRHDITT